MQKNNSASFRHEVTFYPQTETIQANGNPTLADGTGFLKRAKIVEVGVGENLIGDQNKSAIDLELECYYDARITHQCVVVYRGKRYGVVSVVDKDGMKQFMVVGAKL